MHPEIPAEFPGILMDESDEDHDPALDNQDETDEEQIRRVSQTTGVLAHGVGTTGVQGTLGTDPITILVLPQNANTEEDITNDDEEDELPGEDENDDIYDKDVDPAVFAPEDTTDEHGEEHDGVIPDGNTWGDQRGNWYTGQ